MIQTALMLAQRSSNTGAGIGAGVGLIVWLAIIILILAGMWKVYTKAGEPGWAAIIPIFNMYILLKIAGRPWWWLLLFLIPVINVIVALIVSLDVAKSFGKGLGFGIGLWLLSPIFYCILGFGSAQYQGPAAAAA